MCMASASWHQHHAQDKHSRAAACHSSAHIQRGLLTLISLASWHTAHGALHSHRQQNVSCSGVSHVQADARGSAAADFHHTIDGALGTTKQVGIVPHQKYVTQQSPQGFSIKPYFAGDCATACGRLHAAGTFQS